MRNKLKKGDGKLINNKVNRTKLKKKNKYKVRNWREYNQALVDRYDITLWVEKGIADVWREGNKIIIRRKRKVGSPRIYSDAAIESLSTIKELFHLTYRGIEGFGRAIFNRILKAKIKIPDFSTINRRQKTLKIVVARNGREKIDMVIDSSGLKVYGEGEWKVRQHGVSKRRTWRKIHLGIDPATGRVEAVELTENSMDDASMVAPLLNQVKKEVEGVGADGAYDKKKVYDELMRLKVKKFLIPPREDAHIWIHGNSRGERHPRDENLREIRRLGRSRWKTESGYHVRSLVETGVYRFKTIFSGDLSGREIEHQSVEVKLKCKILNKMTDMGMPDSYKVDFKVI